MKKTASILIICIQVLLLAFCALCCVYTIVMGAGSGGQQLPAVTALIALIATAYYALGQYRKVAAKAYKIMLLFCALASLMCIVPHMYNMDAISLRPIGSIVCVIGYAVCFGLYLILALVPDLGKAVTGVLIAVIFCGFFAVHLSSIILRPGPIFGDGTRFDTMRIMRHTCMWALALNVGICSYFKYKDKAARGSK